MHAGFHLGNGHCHRNFHLFLCRFMNLRQTIVLSGMLEMQRTAIARKGMTCAPCLIIMVAVNALNKNYEHVHAISGY